jgi:hypothetical protein
VGARDFSPVLDLCFQTARTPPAFHETQDGWSG